MKGKHKIIVKNRVLHYEFEIKRNITIIQGNSATGKTTLFELLRQHMNLGEDSGIDVICDVPCRIVEGIDWKMIISNLSGNIIFIDEGNKFIFSEEFASIVKKSDNYFVLITRENIYNLPYSVDEIYGIRSSGKYQNTKRTYQQMYRIYSKNDVFPISPQKIIVEDSNSGYDFFKDICSNRNIDCISANGKSNINSLLHENDDEEICVIADGAAIGPEMANLYKKVIESENIKLYLPESFEWLILNSGIIKNSNIDKILDTPENFIDSKKYFSWEQYFTKLLVEKTINTFMQYQKSKLNPVFLHEKNKNAILDTIKGIEL